MDGNEWTAASARHIVWTPDDPEVRPTVVVESIRLYADRVVVTVVSVIGEGCPVVVESTDPAVIAWERMRQAAISQATADERRS